MSSSQGTPGASSLSVLFYTAFVIGINTGLRQNLPERKHCSHWLFSRVWTAEEHGTMLIQSQPPLLRALLRKPGALQGWEGPGPALRLERPPPCLPQAALAL